MNHQLRKNLFEDQIAGPVSGRARNGQFPALRSVNDVSDIIGPGRMSAVEMLLITVTWPVGGASGQLEVEGSDDGSFTGTWMGLGSIAWSAQNKKDQFRLTGAESFVRVRCSTAVTGATGAVVTAKGVC